MFRRKKTQTDQPLPTQPVEYPVGAVVRTNLNWYLINKDGKKYRLGSERAFNSWNFPLVIRTTEAALKNYPTAVTKLGFRDGTLLNNFADGKLYLVSEGKLRHITDPDFFERHGINHLMATVVSDSEIRLMKFGEPIS